MMTPREIAGVLRGAHAMLHTLREPPLRVVELPGASIRALPGTDSAFASATKNRATIYDPGAADLTETLRAAREMYADAGVPHWFAEIGPGASEAEIAAAMNVVGARAVPYVRYPVLARVPGEMDAVKTSLAVRRVSAEEAPAHEAELDAIWGKPGSAAQTMRAVGREGFAVVVAFDGAEAVGMGMLIAPNRAGVTGSETRGGIGYLAAGGTRTEWRGRGGQTAIIAERVRIAREWGCDVCVSETVSAVMTSENNLRRAGFGVVFEWVMVEVGEYVEKGSGVS